MYAAVHVVEDAGQLLVLGATCFARRYGSASALGSPQYGGSGRKLTNEERRLLTENTQALLAQFEAEEAAAAALAQSHTATIETHRQQLMGERIRAANAAGQMHRPLARSPGPPGLAPFASSPWSWQLPGTSVALFEAPDGAKWIRVQHKDGSQKLAPWPKFSGWDRALPAEVGEPDHVLGAVAVTDIVQAIKVLQRCGFRGPVVGRWQDVAKQVTRGGPLK